MGSMIEFITYDINTFDPSKHYKDFHYYEEFDSEKEYLTGKFMANYENENLQYVFVKSTIKNPTDVDGLNDEEKTTKIYKSLTDTNVEKKCYMVAVESLSEEERKKLIPYCTCELCAMSYFNLSRYTGCPCCVGCLTVKDDYYTRQCMINRARNHMRNTPKKSFF